MKKTEFLTKHSIVIFNSHTSLTALANHFSK